MSEFHLSHIALVGARMDAFKEFDVTNRNELKMRRCAPKGFDTTIAEMDSSRVRKLLRTQIPVWVHNIITDPDFPGREKLLMPIRRFEGELKDKKGDEVVSAVMTAGFKSESLNPLDLPKDMSMQQRCAVVAQISVWQEAYQKLENDIVQILAEERSALAQWCLNARRPGQGYIEEL